MDYDSLLQDFARRTALNLKAVESIQRDNPDAEVFEVTQLVNSLLGLIVFPKERYHNSIPELSLEELVKDGWPAPRVQGEWQTPADLRSLMKYLRNAVAHFNIEFEAAGGQITGVRIWNVDLESKRKNWEARYTVWELRVLVEKAVEMLIAIPKRKSANKRSARIDRQPKDRVQTVSGIKQ